MVVSCSSPESNRIPHRVAGGRINRIVLAGQPSLRGVDVLNHQVVWVSGSKGTFARSVDGGATWVQGKIGNDTLLDFRDIHAFSPVSAIAMSAGSPARIYKTVDGGISWVLKYENTDSLIFFDSFDFCDAQRGVAFGDPINGVFPIIRTDDGGETWEQVNGGLLPKPLPHEAGFAASGTSVVYNPNGLILCGTGGDQARVLRSPDSGSTWEAIATPLMAGSPSLGIYSIASIDSITFVITGGNWQQEQAAIDNTAISFDAGRTWQLTGSFPSGFRSAIRYLPVSRMIVASGPNGTDISDDMGGSWQKTETEGYHALDVSGDERFIVFVGSRGRVGWIAVSGR